MGNRRFPLFVEITDRPAVVVGGGTVGLRRAEALARFGADVTVISPALARRVEGVRSVARPYRPGDLEGAFLAVAASDDPAVNAAVGEEARRRGVLFNRADDPADCDFFFPAICEGEGLTAGLVGDGGDHARVAAAARRVREVLSRPPEGEEEP